MSRQIIYYFRVPYICKYRVYRSRQGCTYISTNKNFVMVVIRFSLSSRYLYRYRTYKYAGSRTLFFGALQVNRLTATSLYFLKIFPPILNLAPLPLVGNKGCRWVRLWVLKFYKILLIKRYVKGVTRASELLSTKTLTNLKIRRD